MTRPNPDPIFFLQEQYDADTDPRKIILGVGAYRDGNGKVSWYIEISSYFSLTFFLVLEKLKRDSAVLKIMSILP